MNKPNKYKKILEELKKLVRKKELYWKKWAKYWAKHGDYIRANRQKDYGDCYVEFLVHIKELEKEEINNQGGNNGNKKM